MIALKVISNILKIILYLIGSHCSSYREYYKNLLTDNIQNPRPLCRLPTNDTVSPITLNINGKEISDPIDVGNLFSEYFSSIADNFDVSLQNQSGNAQEPIATNQANCSIPLITIDNILNPAAILDQKKAIGLDGIPAYFIKSSIHSIAPIILRICKIYSQRPLTPVQ